MRKVWLLLIAAVLAVAACGDDDGGGTGEGADATGESPEGGDEATSATCDLLRKREVENALGASVRGSDGDDSLQGQQRCTWILDTERPSSLHVIVYDERAGQGVIDTEPGEPVEGIGDQAFWEEALQTLYVFEEGTGAVMVQLVVDPPPDDPLGVATRLATSVLDAR
jgi:hypothetical protein